MIEPGEIAVILLSDLKPVGRVFGEQRDRVPFTGKGVDPRLKAIGVIAANANDFRFGSVRVLLATS